MNEVSSRHETTRNSTWHTWTFFLLYRKAHHKQRFRPRWKLPRQCGASEKSAKKVWLAYTKYTPRISICSPLLRNFLINEFYCVQLFSLLKQQLHFLNLMSSAILNCWKTQWTRTDSLELGLNSINQRSRSFFSDEM